ncbi:MAG TPA: uroporphyrinogen-III synthase [Chloroflexota bacterium]|nr:uroporphyrinogen-III synthase [Chloroflexota bacterium]
MTHPLAGRRIVATRAEGQTEELIALLRENGAIPIVFPTIGIAPLEDYTALDAALGRLPAYDWVIFTSANGVRHVCERMQARGLAPAALNACKVAAIGPATEALLRENGVAVDLRPDEYVAEAIVAALLEREEVAGGRFLLLRADVARAVLRDELTARGASVDEVPVYRTVLGQPDPAAYAALRRGIDALTFTSSSTVRNYCTLLGDDALPLATRAVVACIGPITARTARERGLHVDVVAREYTVRGLIAALAEALDSRLPQTPGVDRP